MKMKSEVELLERTGAQVTVLDSGCCGMAGPLASKKKNLPSPRLWPSASCFPPSEPLRPATSSSPTASVAASKSAQNSLRRALHLAQILRGDSSTETFAKLLVTAQFFPYSTRRSALKLGVFYTDNFLAASPNFEKILIFKTI